MWYDNIIMYSDLLGNWDIYVFLLWGFCIYNKICFLIISLTFLLMLIYFIHHLYVVLKYSLL